MCDNEQVSAQAAVVLTLIGDSVRCTVLRGSLPELNEQADDMANLLVTISKAEDPLFEEDPRIAALTAEVARLKKVGRTALHRLRMLDRAGMESPRGVDPNYACGNHDVMRELIELVAPELKEPTDE